MTSRLAPRITGRLKAQSKDEISGSIDRADAVMMAIAINTPFTYGKEQGVVPSWTKFLESEYQDTIYEMDGADLGRY
jgi:hypothetical protein